MDIIEWQNKNKWSKELPFQIAVRNGGGLGDMIHTNILGSIMTRLHHFKYIFPKCKIGLWINGHTQKQAEELFETHPLIDKVFWKREETPFRSELRKFFEDHQMSSWSEERIYSGNPWERVYNRIRFPAEQWLWMHDFLGQCRIKLEWFNQKPLYPVFTESDLMWAADMIKTPTIGVCFFGKHISLNQEVWRNLFDLILSKGFRLAFFGSKLEKEYIPGGSQAVKGIRERAWGNIGVGKFYQELSREYPIIDCVGTAPTFRADIAAMKSCIALIVVDSGLKDVAWMYKIPSVFVHIHLKKMTDEYMDRPNGYFWGVTHPEYSKISNSVRIKVEESDVNRDISQKIWDLLCEKTTFLDNIGKKER